MMPISVNKRFAYWVKGLNMLSVLFVILEPLYLIVLSTLLLKTLNFLKSFSVSARFWDATFDSGHLFQRDFLCMIGGERLAGRIIATASIL